jgi:Helix-turn-helix domain
MPWTSNSIFEARRNFVTLALTPNSNIRGLCRHFNISANTAYQTLDRYRAEGEKGLQDRSRALTARRCAVPRPLNWPLFPRGRNTRPGAAEELPHIFNFSARLLSPHHHDYRNSNSQWTAEHVFPAVSAHLALGYASQRH